MSRNVGERGADLDCVVWQAEPTVRAIAGELLAALLLGGALVVLLVVLPPADPWLGLIALLLPVLGVARSVTTAVRGRVVLTREGIEVRRVLTRHYPWASLLSLTIEDDGRIEITPKGWVRKLPIPPDDVPAAFTVIASRRDAARGTA